MLDCAECWVGLICSVRCWYSGAVVRWYSGSSHAPHGRCDGRCCFVLCCVVLRCVCAMLGRGSHCAALCCVILWG